MVSVEQVVRAMFWQMSSPRRWKWRPYLHVMLPRGTEHWTLGDAFRWRWRTVAAMSLLHKNLQYNLNLSQIRELCSVNVGKLFTSKLRHQIFKLYMYEFISLKLLSCPHQAQSDCEDVDKYGNRPQLDGRRGECVVPFVSWMLQKKKKINPSIQDGNNSHHC